MQINPAEHDSPETYERVWEEDAVIERWKWKFMVSGQSQTENWLEPVLGVSYSTMQDNCGKADTNKAELDGGAVLQQ